MDKILNRDESDELSLEEALALAAIRSPDVLALVLAIAENWLARTQQRRNQGD